jgi:hypothetical protein
VTGVTGSMHQINAPPLVRTAENVFVRITLLFAAKLTCHRGRKSKKWKVIKMIYLFFLGEVNEISKEDTAWLVTLPSEGQNTVFKIDCGADITVIGKSTYDKLLKKPMLKNA